MSRPSCQARVWFLWQGKLGEEGVVCEACVCVDADQRAERLAGHLAHTRHHIQREQVGEGDREKSEGAQ